MRSLVRFEGEYLEISSVVWRRLFDHVITPTILHLQSLLSDPKLRRHCNYLCLVGGLSCSPYFEWRMRRQFGAASPYKMDVVVPRRPMLSVVEGAAYLGITPQFVRGRVLRKTYGIKASFTESKAKLNGVSAADIARNRIWIEFYGGYFVKNCFKVLARKKSEVRSNQIVGYCCKRQPGCAVAKIAIICSELEDPKMVRDGTVLAKLRLQFDDGLDGARPDGKGKDKGMGMGMGMGREHRNIQAEFHFYDTMLKVVAYCQSAPHIKKEAQIDYLCK